jgi:phosphodiesterase/alkaline phosphatase D-like protein
VYAVGDLSEGPLRLGPLLRFVDDTSATIWVETSDAGTVVVEAGDVTASARTFRAHGHHYALVEVAGLPPGTATPYRVLVDDQPVWPPDDPEFADFPPSVVPTLEPGKPLRVAFGSCRVSVSHDEEGNTKFGIDALRAYALHMAGLTGEADRWPDLVVFLGDQVYADDTSPAMKEFIASRRNPEQPPWDELKDYEEYAHLYRLAWSDPANRWLLSTLPSAMIFDDHDIRDDWNTSWSWRQEMEATDWWHERVVAGLGSYWVYQHLGNLGAQDRAGDDLWRSITDHTGDDELDISSALDHLADRADQQPTSYRWSFSRDFQDHARLVVVDSRAARVLEPDRRSMLDDDEMAWLDERMRGDVDHLLVGTSLPLLMAPKLHHVEAFGEALAQGAWGKLGSRVGELARQNADLEHWAGFQGGFVQVARMVVDVASGLRGRTPRSITFLSGDVHHSYVAEAWADPALGVTLDAAVVQATCSPIRNPLPGIMKAAIKVASRGKAQPTGRLLGGKVPRSPLRWEMKRGPWFDNNLAIVELQDERLHFWWSRGSVEETAVDRPRLERVATVDVPLPPA